MAEWREHQLGDIGKVVGGGTPSREREEYWGGTIRWLTPGELTGFSQKYVSETEDCITELGLATSGARLLPQGSLLVTSRASIGSCALAGIPMATNQGFKNLIPNAKVDPSFLFHLGRTLGREMTRRASGTTFLEISGREFGRITVSMPPLEEQRRIAEILDTIDETIQATERVVAKRKSIRAGVAASLLSGRSLGVPTKDWKANKGPRPLASTSTLRSWGMAEWQESRLGLVARHFRGYSYSSAELSEDGDDFISLKVFDKGGGFRVDGVKAINGPVPQRFRVPAGAVLIANTDLTRDGDVVGVPAVVPPQFDGAVFSMDATRCVPDSDLLDDRFLALALGTREVRAFMRGISAGSTVLHLDTKRLDQVPLLLPPLEEQRRIADILDTIDETIQVGETQADKLRRLRSGLVADLLSGRVRTEAA